MKTLLKTLLINVLLTAATGLVAGFIEDRFRRRQGIRYRTLFSIESPSSGILELSGSRERFMKQLEGVR